MVRGQTPSTRFLPLDASLSARTEIVIGPRENGFRGHAVALDGPEIWYRCSASVQNITVAFLEVKVKVQGQKRSAISRPWFEICSPNLGSQNVKKGKREHLL